MAKKVYRPKKEAGELREITFPTGDGEFKSVTNFPYETEDASEQAFLDAHPLLTDRAEPRKGDS